MKKPPENPYDNQILLTRRGILNGAYAYNGPRRVELHLTNKCNSNCIVCWHRSPYLKQMDVEYMKQELSYEIVIKLIDELNKMGTELLYISGGGEPLLHPEFWDILGYIKGQGIRCTLNTNFSLITEDDVEKLLTLEVDELLISLWAGSAESYIRTHPTLPKDTFTKIEKRLKHLTNLKRIKGQITPILNIYNIICNLNYREIDGMVGFAKSCGADHCIFATADIVKGVTDIFSLSQDQEEYVVEKLRYWIKKDFDRNLDNRNFVEISSYLNQLYAEKPPRSNNKESACYVGWTFSLIEASGNVSFCCKSTREPVGNIKEDDFGKIWNSERQRKFRKSALSGNIDFKRFSSATCKKGCDNIEDNVWAESIICPA